MDEVHFQQHGHAADVGYSGSQGPRLLHHPTRQSVGYFGAVRLPERQARFRARCIFAFTPPTTWAFLRLLHQRNRQHQRRVVVIADNAKYHHATLHRCWRHEHEQSFQLDYLPPYSPDLNPIERVWKLTRKLCTHDEYFPTLAAFIAAVETQFAQWTKGNDTLRRLCAV